MSELGCLLGKDVKVRINLLFTDTDGFVEIETHDDLIYKNTMSNFMRLKEELLTEVLLEELAKGLTMIQEERKKRKEQE